MARNSKTVVVLVAFAGNATLAVGKFTAALLTGSAAMTAEAVHSTVDTLDQLILLYGMRRAQRPPSATHPFGHGLQLYFWAFVVSILIFGFGAGLSIFEGINRISSDRPLEPPLANYIALGAGFLFEGGSWLFAYRHFRRSKMRRGMIEAMRTTKDPTVITVLLEDSAAMAGLGVATLGIALAHILGSPIYDGIGSICVGLMLAAVAVFLGRESHSLLTGESARPEVVESIRAIAAAGDHVAQVDDVLTIHFGPRDLLVALYLAFDNGAVAEIHPSVAAIKRKITAAHPEVSRVLVEAREAGKRRHRQADRHRGERRRTHHRARHTTA